MSQSNMLVTMPQNPPLSFEWLVPYLLLFYIHIVEFSLEEALSIIRNFNFLIRAALYQN